MGSIGWIEEFIKYLPKGKTLITFLATLTVVCTISILCYRLTVEVIEAGEWVTHSHRVLNEIHETAGSVREIEGAQRGFVITGMDEFLKSYDSAIRKARLHLDKLHESMFDNPAQQKRLPLLNEYMEERIKLAQVAVDARKQGNLDGAQEDIRSGRGREVSRKIERLLDAMEDDENATLRDRYDTLTQSTEVTITSLGVLGVLATALLCLSFYSTNLYIIERRRSEEETRRYADELEAAKLRLDAILASMAEGLYQIDNEGRIVFLNPAGEQILGYTAEELMGKNVHSLIHSPASESEIAIQNSNIDAGEAGNGHPPGVSKAAKAITAAMPRVGQDKKGVEIVASEGLTAGSFITGAHQAIVLNRECRLLDVIKEGLRYESTDDHFIRKDGNVVPVHFVSSPLERDGKVTGAVLTFRDVTQRKEAERRVSEFYSTVSHELRSPLTSIRGALGLMEGGKAGEFSPKAARLIKIAREECDRLIRLINDILDIRKIEAGKLLLFLKEENVAEIVKATVNGIKAMADEAHVTLVVDPIDPAMILLCDRDRIVQVLTNLIGNAIKFSPSGGTVKVVAQTLEHEGGRYVRLSVSDQGPGIAEAEKDKLFHLFQQLDSSDSRPKGGTGLGLAISKALVEQHGGAIGVDSSVGQGSTFWFELGGANMKKDLKEAIAKLSKRFASELPERIDQIAGCIERVEKAPEAASTAAELKDARDNVHQLAGTAGSYGLAEVGNIMVSIEKKLEALMEAVDPRVISELKSDLDQTRSLIATLD
ncbi:MAG: CHASE3 domain-containing protein [Cyanobacteria bacterium SZAS LIN-2]|nr:CHASE3 domain-containing protein [Cyanobacteria bacterium SZAS LIN-3]MBS1999582.1 CHASE3 domain-containing protein [Cyanobacteria bacterium SZAS LIN-2]